MKKLSNEERVISRALGDRHVARPSPNLLDTLYLCQKRQDLDRIRALDRGGSGGGDFYRPLGARTGKRFARAVMSSTLEGQTLFQDAFRMLEVRKTSTFYEAARAKFVLGHGVAAC